MDVYKQYTLTNNLLLMTLYLQLCSAQSVILGLRFSGPIFIKKKTKQNILANYPIIKNS